MAIANDINVTKTEVKGPVPDVIYTLSGKGTENLRSTLQDIKTPFNKLSSDSFSVSKKVLMDMDAPFGRILSRDLEAAVKHSIH